MDIIVSILVGVLLTALITMNVTQLTKYAKVLERLTYVETKMDIYLDSVGLDIQKVNRAIKEHKEELEQNGRPSVGCISVKSLYKEGYDADNPKPG